MAGEFDTFQDLNDVKKQSLRGGLGSLPRGPQKRDRDKTKKPKRAGKKTTFAQERKYQMLKLIKSGRTLREAKALTKALAVGLTPEYLAKNDEKDLLSLEGGLERLTRTRGQQIDLLKVKFGPRKNFSIKKEEFLARWLMDQKPKGIDWKRDGNLVGKGSKPASSRPGSSEGKIAQTRVIGSARTLKDFKRLVKTLQDLQRRYGKGDVKAIKEAMKSLKKTVRAN